MGGTLAPYVRLQFLTNAGAVAAGYRVFTYEAGTSTKAATYQDVDLLVPHTNPIVLDSAGRPPAGIYLDSGSYKFVLAATSTDPPTSPTWTQDNVTQVPLSAASLGPAAMTKTDDTNVTLSLAGTPATSLLRAVNLVLGWTGTLAAARLNASVVHSVVNDTNVTGSIATQALTLGWTGTLGVARGGTGTGTAFTAGSVVFAGASGVYSQDNANLFWDNTSKCLGVGISPSYALDVAAAGGVNALRIFNFTTSSAGTSGIFGNMSNTGGSLWIGVDRSAGGWLFTDCLAYASAVGTSNATALQFATNNAVAVTIDTSRRVGINTNTPDEKLTVAGWLHFTTASQGIKFQDGTTQITAPAAGTALTGGGAANRVAFWTTAANLSYDDALAWDNTNKRLGLGVASPGFLLDLGGAGNTRFLNLAATSTGTGYVYGQVSNTGGTLLWGVDRSTGGGLLTGALAYSSSLGTGGATALHLGTNNTAALTISTAQKVGIGTTAPNAYLDVLTNIRTVDASANYFQISTAAGATTLTNSSIEAVTIAETTGSAAYSPGQVICQRNLITQVSPPATASGMNISCTIEYDSRAVMGATGSSVATYGAWVVNLGPTAYAGASGGTPVGMEINTMELVSPGSSYAETAPWQRNCTVGLQIVPESELALWGATRHGYNGGVGLYISRSTGSEDAGSGRAFAGARWTNPIFIGANATTTDGTAILVKGGEALADAPSYLLKNPSGTYWDNGITLAGTFANVPLDLEGGIATRVRALSLSNGDNNNVALGAHGFQRISGPSAVFAITGMAGGVNGRIMVLMNVTGYTMTLKHQSASSSAANRIFTSTGSDVTCVRAVLIYSSDDTGWVQLANI